jgi:starch synthase
MIKSKKVLFVTQEIEPYVPDSVFADSGRKIPQYIQEHGREIRTFMPKWGNINERRNQLHEVIRLSGMNLIIDDTDHPLIIKVASLQPARMQVYFIDNDDYFLKRGMIGGEDGKEYMDNGERALFYARGVLETVKKVRWVPDLVFCQGWMSCFVPLYVKTAYRDEPAFRSAKVVYAMYDEEPTLKLGENFLNSIIFKDIKKSLFTSMLPEFSFNDFDKLAADYSDGLVCATEKVNATAVAEAKKRGIPVLDFPGEDKLPGCCDQFLTQLLGKTEEEEED